MKIVIAPDSFKESLTALEVAASIERGIRKVIPNAEIVKVPMADGGEGTVQSLIDSSQGSIVKAKVIGPMGNQVQAHFGLMGNSHTAVIEMASASGIHLAEPENRNPLITTTFGTGQLIKAALDLKVNHLILGIGGSATNDAGMGMCQALGIQFLDEEGNSLGYGGGELDKLAKIDLTNLDPRLANVTLEVACDVTNPLCGPTGASHVFGPQKGATPEMITRLDANLAHFADVVLEQLGVDVKNIPGAGAAGGLGAALYGLLNATMKPGIDIVIEATQLEQAIQGADVVITGEGRIDSQTIHGKTPSGVAKVCKAANIPVIGIAGCLSPDCAVVHDYGIDAVFDVVPGATDLQSALENASSNLELTARNVAALLVMFNKQ
ncbi:glycerate kinase [Vibrio porteresiae]|uniref:Glycerate kinase n=1 Tax=Vibrio porteresiae DSM 19223 TaxID=1123496 RepID=A0ABZ0Q8D0_9VIBR|nr:glycerate kinase [Vibrio porteresiae]WPC72702.1 glycerate kinase [Vibrio porteresiae DSM 19223]